MKLGQLLAVVDRIPGAVEDLPRVSAPDFAVVADRLEHVAQCVRLLGELHVHDDGPTLDRSEREHLRLPPDEFSHLDRGGALVRG